MPQERIVITRVGGPDVLAVEEFDPQVPQAGEVAIDVAAVGLNFADLFCRLGLYEAAPPIPFVPGFEVAGIVAATGEGVTAPAVGDRVLAVTRFGGYTSRLNARTVWTRPLPEAWSFEEGAAFPAVFLTAYHGLTNVARLAAGETIVVQSAAGGVGTAACQLARAAGARVIGTVGSESKREVAIQAGAEEVLVSRDYRVWGAVDELTRGEGVDVVFDAVGGPGLRQGYKRLRPGGRLVVYGFASMTPRGRTRNWPLLLWRYLRTPRFDPLGMTGSNRSVCGFNLVWLWERVAEFERVFEALFTLVEQGKIRPVVGATIPFARAREAHALLHSRRSTGKVILVR